METLHTPDQLRTEFHHDEMSDTLVVNRVQDVEPILDANKAAFDYDNRRFAGDGFHQMASIPLVVVEQWRAEGIDLFDPNHAPAIKRKLNDPAWRYLRTKPGRL